MADIQPETPPGQPPRKVTPTVLRRSLFEPHVRFWLIAAGILFVAMLYYLASELQKWNQVREIVNHGVTVTAAITAMGDGSLRGTVSPDNPVELHFTYNDRDYAVAGWLEGRTEPISIKQADGDNKYSVVSIRIDPNDPTKWTYLTQTPPIVHAMLGPGIMALFAVIALAVGLARRARVLSIWKTGVAEQYIVESVGGPTALAPASRAARFRSLDERDQRLICVIIPQRLAALKPGDVRWLIHPPGKPTAALAAVVYEK